MQALRPIKLAIGINESRKNPQNVDIKGTSLLALTTVFITGMHVGSNEFFRNGLTIH